MRPKDWKTNPRTGLLEPDYRWRDGPFMREVDPDSAIIVDEDSVWNQKTNVGCVFAHTQVYGTSPGANGLNYIALSNDSLTENAGARRRWPEAEIASNGLTRHIGTVTLPTGSRTSTTVAYTFTATGAQSDYAEGGTVHRIEPGHDESRCSPSPAARRSRTATRSPSRSRSP